MKKKIKKNIKQRYLFKKFEKNRLMLKILVKNLKIDKKIRYKIKQRFEEYERNTSITRIKNICILTGRSRSIYKFLKISRIQLRNLISKKKLPGFSKYSW